MKSSSLPKLKKSELTLFRRERYSILKRKPSGLGDPEINLDPSVLKNRRMLSLPSATTPLSNSAALI